jgi:hypothetical protein
MDAIFSTGSPPPFRFNRRHRPLKGLTLRPGATFRLVAVSMMRISELAERSGVPTSTLRYYERSRLVEPRARAENGYRLDESAFERQLARVLVRLAAGGPPPERRGPGCGCNTDPLDDAGPDDGPITVTCSLAADQLQERILERRRLLAVAVHTERGVDRVSAVFHTSPVTLAEIVRLCSSEAACCPFLTFSLDVGATATILTIGAQTDGPDMLGWLVEAGDTPSAPAPAGRPGPGRAGRVCAPRQRRGPEQATG